MSGGNELRYFEDSMGRAQVKKLLDNKTGSRGDSEKVSGMKWLLADISKGAVFYLFFVLFCFIFSLMLVSCIRVLGLLSLWLASNFRRLSVLRLRPCN